MEYPRDQKFDKGDLAKCWGAWYQQIEEVCLGTEKYHPTFVEDIDKNKNKFDKNDPDASFKRLVSIIILYNSAYKRVRKEKYGYSYPGNVTDYSVALISHLSKMRLDREKVWQTQKVPDEFIENVDHIAPIVGNTIKDLSERHGAIPRALAKGRKVNGKLCGKYYWKKTLN